MSKKVIVGAMFSTLLFVVLFVGIATVDWNDFTSDDYPKEIPMFPTDDNDGILDDSGALKDNSLPYTVFEKYGIVLIPLAILMFGAIVGGVCIAKEEAEVNDSS